MEVLRLQGYTEQEKLEIAKQYLVKKQREQTGLSEKNIVIADDAILEIIRKYTREAGVRNLEREIGNVCRKVARRVVKKRREAQGRDHGGEHQRIPRRSALPRFRSPRKRARWVS